MIEYFGLQNFRSYKEKQSVFFSVPQLNNPGSGITYIVGENNSGKTTLIEGILRVSGKRKPVKESERINEKNEPSFYLKFNGADEICITTESPGNAYLNSAGFTDFEFIGSRRYWESDNSGTTDTIDPYLKESTSNPSRGAKSSFETALLLKTIHRNPAKKKLFNSFLKRILPDFSDWNIGYEDTEYIKYTTGSGISHKTNYLGDGVISIFRILCHLIEDSSKGRMLIIDEPELSLSPRMLKRLLRVLGELSQEKQILISTHSPYLIDIDYLRNGAILNRVSKIGDKESKIFTIKDFSKYSVSSTNFKSPYKFDVVAKEIFFQDDILFLEGVEDIGLLKTEFSDSDINLFGYGVRGYTQFNSFLELSLDLGLEKVGVIFDNGNNESLEFDKLQKKYGPKYKILKWNKNDIRDKLSCNGCNSDDCKICKPHKTKKDGYFTDEGEKKDIDKLDDFNTKIQEIKQYFCSNES